MSSVKIMGRILLGARRGVHLEIGVVSHTSIAGVLVLQGNLRVLHDIAALGAGDYSPGDVFGGRGG